MKRTILFLFILNYMGCYAIQAQFPEFQYHRIGLTTERTCQTSLADLDQDKDLDWIVGSADTIWWFEYRQADQWVKHILGTAPATENAGMLIDVDGNGFPDQVSGQTWFKHTGDASKSFIRLSNGAIGASDMTAGDINGDGKTDVVYMNDLDGIVWYDFSKSPEKKWKGNKVGEGVRAGIGPNGIGDLDQDGDLDIVRSNEWYENEEAGKKWTPHVNLKLTNPLEKYPNCTRSWVVDMDKDGYNDIVQCESFYPDCKVVWLKRQDKKGLTWYLNKIDMNTLQEIHALIVADFDNDGDQDVFVGGSGKPKDFHVRAFIYENVDGKGLEWKKHEVLYDKEAFEAQAGDVDGDGDIDICSNPWTGKEQIYLRNMLIENGGIKK